MLQVSNAAVAHLANELENVNPEKGQVLRLVASGDGLGLALDGQREGDTTYEHGDRTVLVVDPAVQEALDSVEMVLDETSEGPQLRLQGADEA